MYKKLSEILSISIAPSDELFHILMSGLHGDLEVGRIFCNYINMCFTIRSEILGNQKENLILQRAKSTTTRSGRISKRPAIFDL